MKKGLEPVIFDDSEILILGSLPSDMSIQNEKYYDNPRNQFWDIISYVFEDGSIEFECYEEKLEFLKKHKVALWDVMRCADRDGSLDSNIFNEEYNDIIGLIKKYNIKCVFINGGKATKSFRKYLWLNKQSVNYIQLPSSSSANTRYRLEFKKYLWKSYINSSYKIKS